MNKIDYLLQNPFHKMSYEDKLKVKELGIDQPNIEIKQTVGKINRYFSMDWYRQYKWISVSESSRLLYCHYCVLFGGDSVWGRAGYSNLKHFHDRAKAHETTASHIQCSFDYQIFGKINIVNQLDTGRQMLIKKHNEMVKQNRLALERIIDVIRFCGEHNLPLRGHDESQNSLNRGIFKDLVEYTRNIDLNFNEFLCNSRVQNTSKTIQNDILDSISEVFRTEIVKRIEQSRFISIQADETTDVSCKSQFVLVFRLMVDKNVEEVFFKFIELKDRTAIGMKNAIMDEIGEIVQKDQLMAQAYDGAAAMSGSSGGVQKLIRDIYPFAHF